MSLVHLAYASPQTEAAIGFVNTFKDVILYPIITLMIGVAVLVFLWGGFQLVMNAGDENARSTGKRNMFWGIIGFVVMVSAVALLEIVLGTFGVPSDALDQ